MIIYVINVALFVFSMVDPKLNAGSLWTPVSNTVFYALSHGAPVLLSMVAIRTIF